MKNAITHLKAQRSRRREQHMRVATQHIDALLAGVESQIDEINSLHKIIHERDKLISAQKEQIEKAERKASSSAA